MRYDDAINFIYNLELFGIKMGLGNITRMLQHLDNPQDTFQSIHIAGTNGKGSVASMLFSVLREAGYRVGVFTSPHLVDFRERFRTFKGGIDKRSIGRFIGRHHQFIRDARITFFEISTALAFWHFRQVGVNVGIAEVGLGGRLDATNVLKPQLSVITNIDYDHTKILGSSLEQIAIEKAGIIKPGVPVVTGVTDPKLLQLYREICRERGSTLVRTSLPSRKFYINGDFMRFTLSPNGARPNLELPLAGVHQINNAAVVARSIEVLRQQGWRIPQRAVHAGLKKTRWPGRFQLVSRQPTIILDVAHNPAGAAALARSFKTVFPGRKAVLVFGVLERPDYDVMLERLKPITRRAVVCRPDYRRTAELEGVIWAAVNAGLDFDVRPKVADAVDRALNLVKPEGIVLICGSHFTIGEAIRRLEELRRKRQLQGLVADITYIND
jgi:dihydrofolate synthase/folylpolyglutamate synthase